MLLVCHVSMTRLQSDMTRGFKTTYVAFTTNLHYSWWKLMPNLISLCSIKVMGSPRSIIEIGFCLVFPRQNNKSLFILNKLNRWITATDCIYVFIHPAQPRINHVLGPRLILCRRVHDYREKVMWVVCLEQGATVPSRALSRQYCYKDPPFCIFGCNKIVAWHRVYNPSKQTSIWIVTIVDSGYFVHSVGDFQPTYSFTRGSKHNVRIAMHRRVCKVRSILKLSEWNA